MRNRSQNWRGRQIQGGTRSEQVGNMDLDSGPTDSEGLEGDQGDALSLTCNSHLSESDKCEFK